MVKQIRNLNKTKNNTDEDKMEDECVLTGDLKKSRIIGEWATIFLKLEDVLKKINRNYSDYIIIKFKPTLGDEFQGVLINAEKAYEIYSLIKRTLRIDIYLGIGIGEVEVIPNSDKGTRGSGFYRARDAIDWCKLKNKSITIKSSDKVRSFDYVLNTLFYLLESIEKSWTPRQKEIINYYQLYPDIKYGDLAKQFKITKQAISQMLRSANFGAYSEGITLIDLLFKKLAKKEQID